MQIDEVYITNANFRKIIYNSNTNDLDLQGEVYERSRLYIFNKIEKNDLLLTKEFFENSEKFFNDIYIPIKNLSDTYEWVYEYENQKPSYHNNKNCKKLNSYFENFKIPNGIKDQGKEKIHQYRKWFMDNKYLLDVDPEIFKKRLYERFNIIMHNIKSLLIKNSGEKFQKNYKVEDLEKIIDDIIRKSWRYFFDNERNKKILKKYCTKTYLVNTKNQIKENNTGYSEEEIREVLQKYAQEFKDPLKEWLKEYYRVKFNPDIKVQGRLLENIGFRPCSECFSFEERRDDIVKSISF